MYVYIWRRWGVAPAAWEELYRGLDVTTDHSVEKRDAEGDVVARPAEYSAFPFRRCPANMAHMRQILALAFKQISFKLCPLRSEEEVVSA